MLVPDINAIHQIVPNLMVDGKINRKLPEDEMIWFETRGVNMPDKELLDREISKLSMTLNPEERMKEKDRLEKALVRTKWVKLHNYYVPTPDGGQRAVTELDDFVQVAWPELVAWYLDVIQWGEKLSMAERRNFLPQPASPSGSQSGEAEKSGSAENATPRTENPETATT